MMKQNPMQQQTHRHPPSCHRPLSRASRQLFRQDASPILLHYFGGKGRDAPWRQNFDDALSPDDSSISIDKRGRRRERIPLVDDPDGSLTDEEWYTLLGYAIDKSISTKSDAERIKSPINICPLHPKHDLLLQNDQNSFVLKRRYRTGVLKFGASSLPLSGRAARAAFWLDERGMYRHGQIGTSVFLFQCGICGKTFVSRYYLDQHMETHHQPHGGAEVDSDGNHMLCPADHVCEALGGIPACAETMNQISPYYGPGTLVGKEFIADNNESFLSSSIHSLISHLYDGGDDPTEDAGIQSTPTKQLMKKQLSPKEASFEKVFGEMRHRSSMRNKLLLQAVLHKQREQAMQSDDEVEDETVSDHFKEATDGESIFHSNLHLNPTSSCDEKEMERLFHLCCGMMQTCFGEHVAKEADGGHTLANDLITQICEPLHCHHRLHRMAGHNSRHVAHWNDEWDEHHSFALGWCGWMVVMGVLIFYGCAYVSGLGGADFGNGPLPKNHGQKKKKSI